MKKLLLLLATLTTIFAASPTGPGTFLLKRTALGQPVDLVYFDSVWNLGTGLRRSGDTIYLDYSGVLPGTYGDATHVPQVTIDSFGRITNVSNVTISGSGGGGGTVTSVGLALPASVFNVAGSPIVGSGTLTGSFASQSANTAFMAPNGSAGTPTFRAFLPGDISFLTDSISAARAYALARIHDTSLTLRTLIAAREPALGNPSQSGQVLSSTTGGVRSWVSTIDSTKVRSILHDTALVLRQRIADTSAALRLALTDPAEVRAIVHDTSLSIRAAIPTGGPWLPLAAGSGSPLTGDLYGTRAVLTTTADAPISITHNLAGGFTHPFQAFNSGMVAGNQYNFDFGQSASTNNAGNFGFKYVGAGSTANYVTLGMYGANDLLTITAAGVPKFSGLATAGFVRANASGQLSSSALIAADIPALSYHPLENQRLSTGYAPAFSSLALSNTLTTFDMTSTAAAANGRMWRWRTSSGGGLSLIASNDAGSGGGTAIEFARSGTTATGATVYGGLTLNGMGAGTVKSSAAGLLSSSAPTYAELTGTVPTWNQSTTGNAATATKWATARTIAANGDISWTSASFDGSTSPAATTATLASIITAGGPTGSASVVPVITYDAKGRLTAVTTATITPAAIGAQAAGTYLTPSNVSGTAGQVAVFTGANTVGSSGAMLFSGTPSTAVALRLNTATGNNSEIEWYRDGSTPLFSARYDAAKNSWDLVARGTDEPISVARGAGGTVSLGGNGRPVNLTSGSHLQINGTDAITSARAFRGAAESQFSNGTYTDPHPTFAHDAKFGQNGIATASLYVNGTSTLGALTGATTRLATISAAGHIGATSWTNDGPWLPLAGGTVTGYVGFNNDIGVGRILTGLSNDFLVSFGDVILKTGDGTAWGTPRLRLPNTGANAFRVDGGAQFNGDVDLTGGVTVGDAKQVPSVKYSTSSGTLPILGLNEWCWVIEDTNPMGSAYWTVPTGMTVKYYSGGTTIVNVTAGNTITVVANATGWALYGPTYSGSTIMTLKM